MEFKDYEFNGSTYRCRIVKDNSGNELTISGTKFLDALQPGSFNDENEGFVNKEASDIYNDIFFFTGDDDLKLPDAELIEILKEANPERFD
jgi:hypothetical protein